MRNLILRLLLVCTSLSAFGQAGSTLKFPPTGTILTKEQAQNMIFDALSKINVNTCDLTANDITYDINEQALEFGLTVSLSGINNYSVRIQKNTREWYWNDVPYIVGERMRLNNVPAIDSALVTIRPSQHASCYYSFGYDFGGGGTNDPPCSSGPVLSTISNITTGGLTASYVGSGITSFKYIILNAAGTVTRSGTVTPAGGNINISFGSALTAGNYTLKVEAENCTGSSSKAFVIPVVANPCDQGPTIQTVSSITQNGLTATFHGNGVTQLRWSVLSSSGAVLRTAQLEPSGPTINIIFGTALPVGTYTLKFDGVNCTGTSSKAFIVSSVTPNCANFPIILSVSSVTPTGLTSTISSSAVSPLAYKIINSSGTAIRTGQLTVSGTTLNIGFSSAISDGNYTLSYEGINCTGSANFSFNVTSVSNPDPTGSIVAKVITKGFPEHMDIVINGSGANKTITDNATLTPPVGYTFRYFINDQIIDQNTRLVNFPWPTDAALGIMKFQVKPGLETLNKWQCPSNGYYDCDAARVFSHNTSASFTNIIFDESVGGFNVAKLVPQWMDYMPDMPSTDGDVWVMPVGPISSISELTAKGVTSFSNRELSRLSGSEITALANAGKTYDEVPQTPSQLSLPDRGSGTWVPAGKSFPETWNTRFFDYSPGQTEPLSVDQGAVKGNQYPTTHRIMIFENSEQDHAIGEQWPFWKPFYQNLTTRMTAKFGNTWRIAHNYFTQALSRYPQYPDNVVSPWAAKEAAYGQFPQTLGYATRAQHKAFVNAPISDYPPAPLLPGYNMETVNSACYGVYLNAPDLTADNAFRIIYSAELHHKINKYMFVFVQSFYEWNPNNLQETIFPEGKFYKYVKLPHNPNQSINYAFLSRVFADGWIPFTAASKTSGAFKYDRNYWNNSLWFPNGATTPANNDTFPYWGTPEAFATSGFEDYTAIGMRLYYNTFMKTAGGTRQYLRYRLTTNGVTGPWIEPDANPLYNVIDGLFDKRAIVFSEVKNGKMAVFYLNPYATGELKTVEYQYNGNTYNMQVSSTAVFAKLHTL